MKELALGRKLNLPFPLMKSLKTLVIALPVMVTISPAFGDGGDSQVLAKLAAIEETGGSGEWDMAVRQILVAANDSDGSGLIDTESELAKVSCNTFRLVDGIVRSARPKGSLRLTYGFPEYSEDNKKLGYVWQGSGLWRSPARQSR